MERLVVERRPDWSRRLEEVGFSFHSVGGTYWNEGVCYGFAADEIDRIEAATQELHRMCLEAVDYVVRQNLFSRIGIPEAQAALAALSWKRNDLSLYGRFDLSFDGKSEPSLLEYNADTPTALFEASIVQWLWLEDTMPESDQFNSVHERLTDVFNGLLHSGSSADPLYFTCVQGHDEDFVTVEYLRDVAHQAGFDARHIFIEDIGYKEDYREFCDLDGGPIRRIFKLYPWEWLLADEFGGHIAETGTQWFEPPWKMVLSNKGILPVLWEMYPGHPNLLPAFFEPGRISGSSVRKPFFSREGANITLYGAGGEELTETEGTYGADGWVYQKARQLPSFDGNYPVVGSWVVDGKAAGMGIREDDSPITRNTSRFVPHYFR